MLKIYTLPYCDSCKELIKELEDSGIEFVNINADSSGGEADTVENLLNTNRYPMVSIKKGESYTYIRPGSAGKVVLDGLVILDYFSIPHLVTLIKYNI